MSNIQLAYAELKRYRSKLSKQQYLTLKGQLKHGEITAAMKGLDKILSMEG